MLPLRCPTIVGVFSPRCVLRGLGVKRGPSESPTKGTSDGPSAAYPHPRLPGRGDHGPVCLVDDTYTLLNPRWRTHESLKRLSDSEVLTLALFQQLRGIESERSFLRDAQRFFSHLFPGSLGCIPPRCIG